MAIGFYAGSFDPITYGHLDVMRSALKFCDTLVLAIGTNRAKQTLLNQAERFDLCDLVIKAEFNQDQDRFRILFFDGLVVEAAKKEQADFLVRGVRNVEDFTYEMQMAERNALLAQDFQTIFIPAQEKTRLISSSMIKELAFFGADLSNFVPLIVAQALEKKVKKNLLNQ